MIILIITIEIIAKMIVMPMNKDNVNNNRYK